MKRIRILTCFAGALGFALLAILPFPEFTDVPAYGRPLFAVCALFCLICGFWIIRRGSWEMP